LVRALLCKTRDRYSACMILYFVIDLYEAGDCFPAVHDTGFVNVTTQLMFFDT